MSFRNSPRALPRQAGPPAADGIALLDWSFRIVALDGGAKAILDDVSEHCGAPRENGELPPSVLRFLGGRQDGGWDAAQLQITAGSHEYSCRAIVVKPLANAAARPTIALYLKREISVADIVHQLGLEYHLTVREQETLIGISMGLTSKELAARMKISPNTVKAFLRVIMLKMRATTRAGVVGKLLDQNKRLSAGGPAPQQGSPKS